MYFKGTIIITDPCYFLKEEDNCADDWTALPNHHFSSFLRSRTLYGDWSCHTFKLKSNDEKLTGLILEGHEVLGEFCADGGEVCVALLDEVLKYNPSFDYHKERKWTTTTIENFDGDIQIVNDKDYGIQVVGKGNIPFITFQTGF